MKNKIILTSLMLISLMPLNGVSQTLSSAAPEVKYGKQCFSGFGKSYENFSNFLLAKNAKKFDTEKKQRRFKAILNKKMPEFKFNQFKTDLSCQYIQYKVDDIWADGYIVQPKLKESLKLPVVIINRGGNGDFGKSTFSTMFNNDFPLAKKGFVIIASQYREADEFGGVDIKDVTSLLDIIPTIEQADANRIGMFGASRGGMQSFMASKYEPRVKAIATLAANTDLEYGLKFRPAIENVYEKRIPEYLSNKSEALSKRSVLHWLDDLDKELPILLLHGENDKIVSVVSSKRLATVLIKSSRSHKLIEYPNDDHFL